MICTSGSGVCYVVNALEFFEAIQKDEKAWKMIINDSKGKDEMTKKKVMSAINHKVS